MKKVRLTREESREQTQQRLLDAAQSVIARKGLGGTSVEDIAAAAGYTRGAFYSNFRSKGDLFIELLRREHRQATEEMAQLLREDLEPGQLEQRTAQMYAHLYRDNECFMNWTEARMLAARDARFRAKLNVLMLEKRDSIAAFIEQFTRRLGLTEFITARELAMGFMALLEGVKLFRLSSPEEMTTPSAEGILALFIDAVIQLGHGAKGDTPSRRGTSATR